MEVEERRDWRVRLAARRVRVRWEWNRRGERVGMLLDVLLPLLLLLLLGEVVMMEGAVVMESRRCSTYCRMVRPGGRVLWRCMAWRQSQLIPAAGTAGRGWDGMGVVTKASWKVEIEESDTGGLEQDMDVDVLKL